MGLDIVAYSNLTPVGLHTAVWCEDEDHVKAFTYTSFPQSFRGIPILGSRGDFYEGGCYELTDKTETHDFQAGSYTGYGAWRNDLRQQFNPDQLPDGPFYELIWFADNEGTIGPEAAADLLADFHEHEAAYVTPAYSDGLYADWTRACELAAADGLIAFH